MAKQLNISLGIQANTKEAQQQIKDLQKSLKELSLGTNGQDGLGISKDIIKAKSAAAELGNILQKSMSSSGSLDLSKFDNSLVNSGKHLSDYRNQLTKLGPEGQQAFLKITQSIVSAEAPLKRTSKLLTEFKTTLANTVRWQLSSSMLHGFMGTLQSAMYYARDLNESLNNIRIVTGQSADQMADFAAKANKAAQALSATTNQYTDAALIFYQQGLDDSAVTERTNAVIKMAHATGDAAKEVSSYMTAIWNNFDDGSTSLEHFGDVLTALGASTASSTSEISAGLEKFASIAQTVGLSYEYATSALATVVAETRQSADVVGTAFKTMFARIGDLELGKTLEDGVDLGKYSQALDKVGVSILDATGNMRKMDDILDDLASKWDTLTNAEQTALAETVAGTRQYTQLMSLMNNWDDMKTNLNTANNADGTLDKQQEIYAESWEAARDRVKAAAEEIYNSLIDDKFFIGVTDAFAKFLNGIDAVIDGLGGLKGVLPAVYLLMTKLYGEQMATGIDNIIHNIQRQSGALREQEQILREQAAQEADKVMASSGTAEGELAVETMKKRVALMKEISAVSESLTAEGVEQLQAQLDIVDAYDKQTIAMAKVHDQASDSLQNSRTSLVTKASRNGGDTKEARQALSIIQQYETASKRAQIALQKMNANFKTQEISKYKNELKNIRDDLLNAGFDTTDKSLQLLENTIKSGSTTVEQFHKALQDIASSGEFTEEAMLDIDKRVDILAGDFEWTTEELDQFRLAVHELVASGTNLDDAIEGAANATQELHDRTKAATNAIQQLGTTGQTIIKFSQSISQVAMGLSALSNLGETLFNPDTTGLEKFQALMISGPMVIMSMVSAIQGLTEVNTLLKDAMLTETAVESKNLILKGILTAKTWLQTAANTAEEGSLFGVAAGFIAAQLAAAPLLVVTIALVAAIGLLVAAGAGIVLLVKHLQKNSLAGQLETAKKAAEELSQAADDAKDKAEGLRNAFDQYNSVTEKLDNCTKGTKEWYDALEDVNNQVLEMIQNYPELMKYVNTRSADGQLSFKKGTEAAVVNAAQEKANSATYASLAANAQVDMAQVAIDKQNLYNKLIQQTGGQHGDYAGVSILLKNLDKLSGLTAEEYSAKLKELGVRDYSISTMEKYQETVDELAKASELATEKLEMVGQVVAAKELGSDYDAAEKRLAGDSYNKRLDEIKDAVIKESHKNEQWDKHGATGEALMKRYWEAAGISGAGYASNMVRGTDDDRTYAYIDANGEEKEVSEEQMAATIAASEALEQLEADAQEASKALMNLNNSAQGDAIKGWIAGDGFSGVSQSDLSTMSKSIDSDGNEEYTAEEVEKYLSEQFGMEPEKIAELLNYDDVSAMTEDFLNQFGTAEKAFENIPEKMFEGAREGFKKLNTSDLAAEEQKAIADVMDQAFLNSGSNEAFTKLYDAIPVDKTDEFAQALQDIDWSTDGTAEFKQKLEDVGIDTSKLADEDLNALIVAMGQTSLSATDVANKFEELNNIISGLKDGDSISSDDYDKLGAEYQQYFHLQLDGTYKLIGAAKELQDALKTNEVSEISNIIKELTDDNSRINSIKDKNYDFDELSKTQNYKVGDENKYNGADVQKQLDLIADLNQGNVELAKNIEVWKADLADGTTDTATLQAIADTVESCRGQFEGLDDQIETNNATIFGMNLMLAESYDNFSDLEAAYKKGDISLEAFNTAAKELDDILDTQDLDPEELEDYSNYLKQAAKNMDGFNDKMNDNEAKIVAKSIMKMNKGIETLADNFVDAGKDGDYWIDILKKSSETSEEYATAMKGTKSALADLLDVSEDFVSNDFVKTHLDEINQAATGDADAIDNLKSALADDIICNILINNGFEEGSEDYVNILNSYNSLKESIPDISVATTLEVDDFIDGLNQLITDTGMTVAQVNALCDGLGFEAAYATEEVPTEYKIPITTTKHSRNITAWDEYNNPTEWTDTESSNTTYETAEGEYAAFAIETAGGSNKTSVTTPKISGLTKKATGSSNNYSSSNSGGRSTPGSSSGGGGKRGAERRNVRRLTRRDIDKEKISNKERDKERERYVEINDKIDDVNETLTTLGNKLNTISAQEERAFGATKQKLLQQQRAEYIAMNEQLEQQYENYKQLEREQKKYLKSDRKKAEKAGWSFDKNGNVKNYDETFNKLTKEYNDAVDAAAKKYITAQNAFNALDGDAQSKDKNKNALDKAEEAYNNALEKAKTKREEAIELLQQVQEDQEALEDTQHKLEETIEEENENKRKILDKDLETINHALELTIEVDEDALKQLELEIKLLGTSAELAAKRMSKLIDNNNIQSDEVQGAKDNVRRILINQLGLSEDQAKAFLNGDSKASSQVYEALNREDAAYDSAAIWEALKNDLDIIDGAIESLEDNMTNAFSIMNDFLDETMEAFDRSSQAIQHAKTLTQGYKDIMTAVGRRNVDKTGALTQQMDKALISQSGSAYDAATSKKDTAQHQYDELLADYESRKKTGQMTQTEKEEYKELINTALENLQTAEEEAQTSLQEWLQSISDYYTDQIELIKTQFEETVAGAAQSISWLKEQMSMKDARDNQYVEDYERIYQLSKLTREVTKKIDESDNIKVKKMLAEYQGKIVKLQQEGTELSQHDLEYLQKQYEITLAKAQLEEAQNTKTQVRMTRDSEGNFSYIYTANEQNIEDAEQNYETKLYEAQKLNNDYIDELENLIISAQEEMSAKIEEIMLDETLTYEEQQKKIEEIKDHYLNMMDYYEGELTNTLNSNKELYNDEWKNYHEATGHEIADISTMKTEWSNLSIAVLTGKTNMSSYFSDVESAIKTMSSSSVTQLNIVKESMGNVLVKAGLMTSKITYSKDENGKATSKMSADWTSFGNIVAEIVEGSESKPGLVGAASKAAQSSKDMASSYKQSFKDIQNKFKNFLDDYEKKATSMVGVNSGLSDSIADVGEKAASAANSLAELIAEINALEDRTITITINYEYNDPKDKTPPTTTKKPSTPSTTTKKALGSNSGSKPSWSDVIKVYNLINKGTLGNGREYRTEEAEKYGYDKETYLLAQEYVNLVYSKNLGGKGYSAAAAKKALGYDTGGYTGDWHSSEGKLAFLHQKEIVLNQEDTKNMLAVVNAVRDISKMIDLNVLTSLSSVGTSAARFNNINKESLEQNVHITAEFPNVTDKNEILDAFDNVINLASQYANKKN